MRGAVAGARGVAACGAARTLFEAGGRKVLPAAVQQAVRSAVENEASRLLLADTGKRLLESSGAAAGWVEGSVARAVAAQTVRGAGRQLLRGVTAAAGAGAMVDGGWALVDAARRMHARTMTGREAVAHVAREAGTGAAATAAGTAAAALLVALTGGVVAPAVFVVGAAASLGAKMALDAWLRGRLDTARRRGYLSRADAPPNGYADRCLVHRLRREREA
jgi:hypothetical protein